jgi:2-polyprenyl-6-methoxyphenol hydroxylase-like FAD-dependent oxidoreductase
MSSAGAAVSAIRFENGNGRSETLPADLVIEASGRGNLTLGFLESTGQRPPEETVIGVDIGYATAVLTIPSEARPIMTFDTPARGGLTGIILPLERNRWIVTLVGRHDHKPPGDWDGFLAYAQQLRTPTIYQTIKCAEKLGEIARFGFPASLCRHLDRIEEFPRGLLPIGDAICRFNPVHGQGMSVSAQEACLLRELLRSRAGEADPLDGLAKAFFAEAAKLIETPWALAAIPDYAVPETEGQRPEDLEQRLAFSGALFQLAATDAAVHKLLVEVLHLLKPQSVLNDPDLVERVKALAAQA